MRRDHERDEGVADQAGTGEIAHEAPRAMLDGFRATLGNGLIQRKLAARLQRRARQQGTGSHDGQQQVAQAGFQGAGAELPHRAQIESSMGVDLSHVRAFSGAPAANACDALDAHAYAVGDKIAFSSPSPSVELAAHEAAHVVQQAQGVQRAGRGSRSEGALESEADAAAERVVAGESARDVLGLDGAEGSGEESGAERDEAPGHEPAAGGVQLKSRRDVGRAKNAELEAFKSKKYSKKNFQSSTKIGLFDVEYNPKTGRMEARVRLKFDFVDGAKADYPAAKDAQLHWSKKQKQQWRNDFISLVEGRWGGKFRFTCTKPALKGLDAFVDVEVEDVKKDWHFAVKVTKIPPGQFKTSSVTTSSSKKNKNTAKFDSEDMKWADKGGPEKQMAATHEFGHMIGLDDEYENGGGIRHAALVQSALGEKITEEDDSNNVMSTGNHIKKQHYVTFWEALRETTGVKEWKFA